MSVADRARIALVSGGGTGIGRAVARDLVGAGLRVVLLGRRPEPLESTAKRLRAEHGEHCARWCAGDLSRPEDVRRVVEECVGSDGDGAVDVVVNNAGGSSRLPRGSLEETAAVWNDEWQRNVLTAVLLTSAVMPHLHRGLHSRVVSVSSVAALRGGGPYGAAKAALHAWTYTLARELGGRGTANVVAPGYVEETEFFGNRMTEQRRAELVGATLVGRPSTPDAVASAVRWLVSPEAQDVTGQVIQVNGGAVLGRG